MIFILAQGRGSRWIGNSKILRATLPCDYKQLVPVNGEPNIFRTIRMLEEMEKEYMIVAEKEMFTNLQLCCLSGKLVTLKKPGNILNGIFQLLHYVNETSTFLLGDVIFSKHALNKIVEYDVDKYTLWGRNSTRKKQQKKFSPFQ